MSDWKEKTLPLAGSRAEGAAKQLIFVEDHIKRLNDERNSLIGVIKEEVNTNVEGAHDVGNYVIDVTRKQRLTWDTDKLETLLVAKELPEYIKRKLSIDKKTWDQLDADTQDNFAEALKITTTVTISVKEKAVV